MPTQFDQLLQYTVWGNDVVFGVRNGLGAKAPASSVRLELLNTDYIMWVRQR